MALQSSGSIKFSDIQTEFGTPTGNKFGSYRVSQSIAGKTWVLDTGIPTSGQLKFSDFYGKRLNIVIDSGTGADEFNVTLTNYYNTKSTVCVGGFKSPPASAPGNTKYHLVLRKDYGGASTVTTSVKSGFWPSGSQVNIYLSGGIYGRGGNGGNGGFSNSGRGGDGGGGFNAMGFSYSCNLIVESTGKIIAGAGGGAGGGGNHHNPDPGPFDPTYQGGGGGGGLGNPGGSGGNGAGAGSKTSGGNGGQPGCFPQINASAGGGGGGGAFTGFTVGSGVGCQGGGWCSGSNGTTGGFGGAGGGCGAGGGNGAGPGTALLANSGVSVNLSNSGTILPSTTVVTSTFS